MKISTAVFSLALALASATAGLAGDRKAHECLRVNTIKPLGDYAYEYTAENTCSQSFPIVYFGSKMTDKDGYTLGHAWFSIANIGGKEKYHAVLPAVAARVHRYEIFAISDKQEDVK